MSKSKWVREYTLIEHEVYFADIEEEFLEWYRNQDNGALKLAEIKGDPVDITVNFIRELRDIDPAQFETVWREKLQEVLNERS